MNAMFPINDAATSVRCVKVRFSWCLFSANVETWAISGEDTPGMNILGLVVFATVLGITLGKMGPSGKPLLSFFEALSSAMMIITNWVIW